MGAGGDVGKSHNHTDVLFEPFQRHMPGLVYLLGLASSHRMKHSLPLHLPFASHFLTEFAEPPCGLR